MSNSPDTGFDLEDLELHFLPAWAKQSPDPKRYAKFEGGGDESGSRRPDRQDRHERRDTRRERPGRGEASSGRRPVPEGDRGAAMRREGGRQGQPRREERREPAQPLPEVNVTFVPEEKGVESIAKQIKLTGRAYPIFDIAHLILRKPDRYHATFSVVKKPDGQIAQPLWVCNLDDTLWLSEPDAVDHVLRRHFETFYKAEKTPTDPPKGTYTFVFEAYKAKVRIVKDDGIVKKWREEQSWKTEFVCLNVPEPKTLGGRPEVEKHFREVHLANIIRTVEAHALSGIAAQQIPTPALRQLLRRAWDEQTRFPIKIVNILSQQFATHGLQFFKVNKSITHVAVARPHYLDLAATPVSNGVKRIVEYIDAHPGCTRRELMEALAPSLAPPATPVARAPDEGAPQSEQPVGVPTQREIREPTAEQTAVIADLHWLIHQGHVLEFANGKIETAKRPSPKPLKPKAKPPVGAGEPVSLMEASANADSPSAPVTEPTPGADGQRVDDGQTNQATPDATPAEVAEAPVTAEATADPAPVAPPDNHA